MNQNDDFAARRAKALSALAEALHVREKTDRGAEETHALARLTARRCLARDPAKASGKLRDKLKASGIDSELAGQVVREMAAEGWQDEERAALRILKRHEGRKAKARAYLMYLLRESGIAAAVADKVCAELPDDRDSIRALIPELKSEDTREKLRLIRRLRGRGYTLEVIQQALREKEEGRNEAQLLSIISGLSQK